jgi:glycosyltransferase involved in cell wall biosynthesis
MKEMEQRSMKKKKICFICPNLGGGGVERMVLHLLTYLDREKYTPFLVLFEKKGIYLPRVPGDVKIICLEKKSPLHQLVIPFTLAFKIFPGLKPDVVMSFMLVPNILTLPASLFSLHKFKTIISIRNNPPMDLRTQRFRGMKELLMKCLYPCAHRITVISSGIKESLVKQYGFKEKQIAVIYNGIDIDQVRTLSTHVPADDLFTQKGAMYITACGRLTYQKGFSCLIEAFSNVADRINALLYIFGEGEERGTLAALIKERSMADRIFLPGFLPNPFPYIARSDLFVLSSLYEGFGNVIVEAMACGTTVLSTDCPYGPGEIINHGVNGILVPPGKVEKMGDAILRLMEDKELRRSLAEEGNKQVEEFAVKRMVGGYERVWRE